MEGGLCARERTRDLLPMAMVRLIMRLGAKLTTSTASATGYMTCNSKVRPLSAPWDHAKLQYTLRPADVQRRGVWRRSWRHLDSPGTAPAG